MPELFTLQPEACRRPLPLRAVSTRSRHAAVLLRILAFDPLEIYQRIAISADPRKRIQTRRDISLAQLFPKKRDGCCDCSCGQKLAGRQTRWAAPECAEFAWYVYAVIAGRRTEIKRCLKTYYGRKCAACNKAPRRFVSAGGKSRSGLEFDHVIPVHQGGGACWLGNYRPLCVDCHREKTGLDRMNARPAIL